MMVLLKCLCSYEEDVFYLFMLILTAEDQEFGYCILVYHVWFRFVTSEVPLEAYCAQCSLHRLIIESRIDFRKKGRFRFRQYRVQHDDAECVVVLEDLI
jgi:hypothetical protein